MALKDINKLSGESLYKVRNIIKCIEKSPCLQVKKTHARRSACVSMIIQDNKIYSTNVQRIALLVKIVWHKKSGFI